MDVSVIIVNWNGERLLPECLDSIPAGVEGLRYEVIVVDNASQDKSVAWLMVTHPEVQLIPNTQNVGFARANNQALRVARGRYALLLNNDARLKPRTVTFLLDWLETHSEVGAVSPRLVNPDGTPQAFAFGQDPALWYLFLRGVWGLITDYPLHDWGLSTLQKVHWVAGTSMVVRRAVWETTGLLDEKFFMYFEDVDWCRRMRQTGWQVWYDPRVETIHLGGQSLKRNPRAQKAYEKSLCYFYTKHYPKAARSVLRVMLAVYRRLQRPRRD